MSPVRRGAEIAQKKPFSLFFHSICASVTSSQEGSDSECVSGTRLAGVQVGYMCPRRRLNT
jgi:hypothetical protein